ncbi:5413_t:CDS:2 [Dentiscutata heterogama]|uniref:5413_t:CDS:1 n=1 Tax=Dentiscutata heterogama TaxID=1316150 RepID=A0ACA9K0C2_9GLOM|nr:5413_t:CDS:2 [Dentiscutata heterogama]
MKSFSKFTITILIYFLCQSAIGFPISQKPKVLIQLTDGVTVVLTNQNGVNKEPSNVYMTTVEHPNIETSEIQFPKAEFLEIQIPEVNFPSFDSIFEKIRESFESDLIIMELEKTVLRPNGSHLRLGRR